MDKYVKVRQIGEGAFGKAVLVRQKQNNKQMVIKEINIAKMNSKEREEARKEVAVLAQLHHPNIVAYRESFEERGLLYIVMDFCEKGDLYSKINAQRGILIPEDQVLDMFVQMCLAIKHIHDRKILHRDIKSQNIFLTADGSIKLGDFGIAKVLNSTVELARTCIGTPYYLSPEICENRPYNNKSDIWSLGCVLYEMTTLKHAYEAGNMKNLVLKIIRGSYPPIPPKYSYELRGLIAKLFKRTPKDRPSINSILKTNFITKRVTKFLSEDQIQEEFSHTVMHGQKLARKLPPPPPSSRPPSAAGVRKPVAGQPPARYNPASVYGAPVAGPRKSKENRGSVDVKKRPGSAGSAARPGSAGRPGSASQDLKKKKEDMILKEKKRRMEENKAAAEKKHRELLEKQKLARINKAREDNWKNMINSLDSDEGAKKVHSDKHEAREPVKQPRPLPEPPQNIAQKDRGNYERYHAYLDKIQKNREAQLNNIRPAQPAAAYMVAPKPLPAAPKQAIPHWQRPSSGRTPEPTPIYPDPKAGGDRPVTPAEERARIVDEFVMRKREAAMNRQRGNADLFGNAVPAAAAPPPYAVQRPRQPATPARHDPSEAALESARDREEKEYLEKLKQIRMQNFQERRQIQGKPQDAKAEAEARRRKVEALRQQADDRAKHLKEQLERQRRDKYDQGRQKASRPVPAPCPVISPAPAVAMTAALKAVGVEPKELPKPTPAPAVGMTGALKAIGVVTDEPPPVDSKSPLKQQKEEILRRLNEKVTPRGKWGAPGEIAVEEEVENPPESSRSRWQDGASDQISIKEMPLEQTASQMEATSLQDRVIQHPATDAAAEAAAAVSRRQWGRPGSTVLNALKEIPIKEGTIESDKSDDSVPSSTEGDGKPAKGSTITLSPKPAINKGTITIGDADEAKQNKDKFLKRPDISQPISEESNTTASQNKDSNQTTDKVEVPSSAKPPLPNKLDHPPKPVVAPKPQQDVLPTPVLLAKPDSPMNFGQTDQTPKAVDLSGDGKLFEKVDKDEAKEKDVPKGEISDKEAKGQSNLSPSEKRSSGVILGLTSGQFDIGNAHMLRTCSEPDLAKLFKTLEQSSQDADNPQRVSLDLEKQREQVDPQVGLLDNVELDLEEEDINIVDDDEYEELLSVRETMQSLLIREYSTDEESQHSASRLSMASNHDNKINEEEEEEEEVTEENEDDKKESHVSDDSDNEDAEEYQRKLAEKLSDGDQEEENNDNDDDLGDQGENNEGEENIEENQEDDDISDDKLDLFQSDDSDADTQFGDDEEDYDLFSRLEESRAELENQLGCEMFLKVYKTVQALQEDEDENMEDGVAIVTKMLGKEKEHLYPKIFQLVMADSAFTEDN